MKRFIAMALTLCCILGCFTVSSNAYELTEEDYCANFETVITSYLSYAECYEGYFAENTAPSDRLLYNYILNNAPMTFPEYCVATHEDEESYVEYYRIPGEILESFMGTLFTETPELIDALRALNIYEGGDEPYYKLVVDYFDEDFDYGDTPEIEEISFYGYEPLENNEFLCYTYAVTTGEYDEDYNFIPYEPIYPAKEGVDYIYVLSSQMDYDTDTSTLFQSTKYVPAKITGAIKSRLVLNGETVTVSSYEEISLKEMRSADIPVTSEISATQLLYGLVLGAAIDIRRDTFEDTLNTEIITTNVNDENVYKYIADALGFDGYEENVLSVINVEARCGKKIVQPRERVEISMTGTADYGEHLAICRIEPDGSVQVFDTVSTPMVENEIMSLSVYSAIVDGFNTFALVKIPETKRCIFDSKETLSRIEDDISFTIGDVNLDGDINAIDSFEFKLYLAKAKDIDLEKAKIDVNNDGKVQVKDLLAIDRYIAGLDDGYNIGFSQRYVELDSSDKGSAKITNVNGSMLIYINIDTEDLSIDNKHYNYAVITYKCDKDTSAFASAETGQTEAITLEGDGEYHSVIINMDSMFYTNIDYVTMTAYAELNQSINIRSISFASTYEAALYEAVYQESRA